MNEIHCLQTIYSEIFVFRRLLDALLLKGEIIYFFDVGELAE